eukprot:TRINITY_DN11984_c0_g1_i2.p1 TRINITY_DN11984_c0_g1~~TRINITY_DN11984_c0_g1_i2.p1  ORF type:complete len:208 (+),score=65.05 TRINITY_DN11984_c0_g1_i2:145-768(+)
MTEAIEIEDFKGEFKNPERNYKIIIIGETGVGKTCIMLRACRDMFVDDHSVTLGADFASYCLTINKVQTKLQLWDTCGLEMYKSLIRVFFKGTDAAMLVFDVTSENSFERLGSWLQELRGFTSPDMQCYLVGNKIDMLERTVTVADAHDFVVKNGLSGYFETSAKSGSGVREAVREIAKELYRSKKGKADEGVKLQLREEESSTCPC